MTPTSSTFAAHAGTPVDDWQPVRFAALMFAALLLPVSFLWTSTRDGWDVLDEAVFRSLNESLLWHDAWAGLWAVANWRPFDAVAGLVILILLVVWIRSGRMDQVAPRIVTAFCLIAGVLLLGFLTKEVIAANDMQRYGPSDVLDDPIMLDALVPWIHAKDTSNHAFPGDHGAVLMMVAVMLTLQASRRLAIVAWVTLMPFALPRLVAGAHWLTDIAVGSAMLVLVMTAVWYATPFSAAATRFGVRFVQPILDALLKKEKDPEAGASGPQQ